MVCGLILSYFRAMRRYLFSGDKDLICNYLGTEYLIGNMTWNGAQGFGVTQDRQAKEEEKKSGSLTRIFKTHRIPRRSKAGTLTTSRWARTGSHAT